MPTRYPSYRYANDRRLDSKIPPHDLALVRLLMKFDGQFMRNGVKLLATSHYRQNNHICYPKDINWYDGYHCRVSNLTLNDFRNAMLFYKMTEWHPCEYDEAFFEKSFMESQGNWTALHHALKRYGGAHFSHLF